MNHIARLTEQRDAARAEADQLRERLAEFREHLASPKFSNPATDGSRVDWISTADVDRWIRHILFGV